MPVWCPLRWLLSSWRSVDGLLDGASTAEMYHDSKRSVVYIHRLFQLIQADLFRCVQRSQLLFLFL